MTKKEGKNRKNPQVRRSNESCLAMKIIAGLGNPGRKYNGTRHNIGWEVLSELARRHGTSKPKVRFQGEAVDATIGTESVLLLCPITFMNASGESLLPAKNYYRLDNQDLLVVCDDFNLPVAKLRFRSEGSSGGQKDCKILLINSIRRSSLDCDLESARSHQNEMPPVMC